MDTEHNILFGVLAVQSGAIDAAQLQEAYADWSANRQRPLGELLVARGWISDETRASLEQQVARERGALGKGFDPAGGPTEAGLFNLPATLVETIEGAALEPTQGQSLSASASAGPVAPEPSLEETAPFDAPTAGPAAQVTEDFASGPGGRASDATTVAAAGDSHSLVRPLSHRGETTERYTKTRLHARGGIGQVWLARDDTLGREVALKELRPDRAQDAAAWARFFEEARITGQLEHPGIVPIYELSRDPGGRQPFYTMRFVRGGTLSAAIDAYHKDRRAGTAGPLELASLLHTFVGVCNAIGYAHSRGVIHRDLKGQNIILGEFGEVMVLDWGLAKLVDQPEDATGPGADRGAVAPSAEPPHDATQPGQVQGTPAYMAPEQAWGRVDQIGPPADIYALGAILYGILCGEPPYQGETATEVLRKVREEAPARPRAVNPDAPAALEAVCLKAMARQPEDRYHSAGELADEVRRWLADEPVAAYPEPWTRRLARWAKRHRQAVAAAAAVAVIGVGALGVSTVLVRRERDEARQQREVARSAVNDMYTGVAEDWLEDYLDPKQQEFLEKALDYYQNFAGRESGTPATLREAALAMMRVGDIHRKLGRDAEAEQAYRGALSRLDGLGDDPRASSPRARLRSRLGALLVVVGRAREAAPLLDQARQDQERRLQARSDDPEAAFDLARTCREQANLLRQERHNAEARDAYARAVAVLEPVVTAGPDRVEPRRELGTVLARLGVLQTELGDQDAAEATFRRGLDVLEPLLAEFPTNPRIRESLAETLDSLARLLRRKPGSTEEAEARLRLAVGHYQRLADDFPGRAEYHRILARGWINLGSLYVNTGRPAEAEGPYRKAAETLEALQARVPDEPKVRRDLGIARNNLGSTLEQTGHAGDAVAEFRRAIAIQSELVQRHPDVPDYRKLLAGALLNLGRVVRVVGTPAEADDAFQQAARILEDLAARYPDMPEYRSELADALASRGVVLSAIPDRQKEAEPTFRQAVGMYDQLLEAAPQDPALRARLAECLSNLAELKIDGQRLADARALYDRSLGLFQALADEAPDDPAIRQNHATVMINLGEYLADSGKPAEAEPLYAEATAILTPLAAENAPGPEVHQRLAYLLTNAGKLFLATNRPGPARENLQRAMAEQRTYLRLVRRSASASAELREQIALLGQAIVEQGQYQEAAEVAVQIPKQSPDRPDQRVVAARLLARCATLAGDDRALPENQRAPLARLYADRAVAQLRVAIDSGYQPARPLGDDPDFAPLQARADFRDLQPPPARP
jgi:tetratricopeptide (TPR) repeat protein/tRNA A-37 threonylcarbamoyl transferase component Bud32